MTNALTEEESFSQKIAKITKTTDVKGHRLEPPLPYGQPPSMLNELE